MPGQNRDLRLDFFRGGALLFIFIDHVPNNVLGYFTLHSVAFCDSAEVFIFISGYSAGLVYGMNWRRNGALYSTVRVWQRVWQLYVAHIFLFVIFTASVSYTVSTFSNPMYSEEMQVGQFLIEPHVAIVKALLLQFQPTFLDILPLYIVLLGTFPLVILILHCHPALVFVPSMALYVAVQNFSWLHLYTYPGDQAWFFNPLAWQFLFIIGAIFGHGQFDDRRLVPNSRWLVTIAALFAAAALVINLSWTIHWLHDPFPPLLLKLLFPISKTDLAPLRLINVLALVVLARYYFHREGRLFQMRWVRPVLACGQNSLDIFCLGVMLSLFAHFILVEFNDRLPTQLLVILTGLALMMAVAMVLDWVNAIIAGPRLRSPATLTQGKPSE